jgi:hypothetical protein
VLDLLVKRVESEELGRDGHRLVILLPPEPREGEEDGIHALGRERELRGMVNGDLDGRTSIHVHARTHARTHAHTHTHTHTHKSYTNHRRLDIDSQKSRQPTRHRQPEIEQPLTEKGFD